MYEEFVLKVPLVGSHDTGKTTLVQRICANGQSAAGGSSSPLVIGSTRPTVGVEFSSRIIRNLRPNTIVRLQLWDTAGTEKYAAVAAPVYRNAGGVIAVCDVTNEQSLADLIEKWLPRVFTHLPSLPMTSVLVVCNKCDLAHDDTSGAAFTPIEAAERLEEAGFKGMLVLEGSALTGANIESAVALLCSRIIKKFAEVSVSGNGGGGGGGAPTAAVAGKTIPKGASEICPSKPASSPLARPDPLATTLTAAEDDDSRSSTPPGPPPSPPPPLKPNVDITSQAPQKKDKKCPC